MLPYSALQQWIAKMKTASCYQHQIRVSPYTNCNDQPITEPCREDQQTWALNLCGLQHLVHCEDKPCLCPHKRIALREKTTYKM